MVHRPSVGVGVFVLREEKLLLLRRKNVHGAGSWSSPGGHLEFGESLEACAIRETLEETGLVIANVRFRAITNDLFEAEGKHYVTVWMEGTYVSGDTTLNAPYEASEIGWFPIHDLPGPLFQPLENLLTGKNAYPNGGRNTRISKDMNGNQGARKGNAPPINERACGAMLYGRGVPLAL